jgi:hypothetical protein
VRDVDVTAELETLSQSLSRIRRALAAAPVGRDAALLSAQALIAADRACRKFDALVTKLNVLADSDRAAS